jgi:hypothetical protein
VRTSDGTLYAVYFKQLSGYYQIYVAKSTDNGATWTGETRISTYSGMESYHQYYPSIAVDSNNYLHVVWYGMATGYTSYYQIWYAKYTTSWQTPVRISTYSGMESYNQSYPSIAVDSNNYLHVVWYGCATGYTSYSQIWYAKYTTSWATPVRISTYSGMESYSQAYPSIAVDSNNYLHVVWYGMATGYTSYYQIWYAKYTTSWQTPVRISTYSGMESYHQYYPSIAVDSNNYLHVVWYGRATGYTDYNKVWYAEYTTSWQTPTVLQATGHNILPNLRWSRYPTSNQVTTRLDYVFTEGTASPYNVKFAFLSFAVAYTITLTESLGLKDSTVKASSVVKSEPLGLSDVVVKNLSVAKAESLGLSDTISAVKLFYQILTEPLGLSDFVAKAPSVVKVESLGLLDYYSRIWSVHRTYSENLGLADYVQKSPSTVKSELLGLSDVVQKSSSILKSEVLGLSDFYSRTWTAYRTYTESLGLSDVLGKASGKTFSEPLGLKDTFTRTWSAQKVFTETLGLKDTVSKGVALHALVEVLGLYDRVVYAPNVTVLAKLVRKYMQLVNLGGDWNE